MLLPLYCLTRTNTRRCNHSLGIITSVVIRDSVSNIAVQLDMVQVAEIFQITLGIKFSIGCYSGLLDTDGDPVSVCVQWVLVQHDVMVKYYSMDSGCRNLSEGLLHSNVGISSARNKSSASNMDSEYEKVSGSSIGSICNRPALLVVQWELKVQ
ncbi:hypothetical protein Tco_1571428 [Tanacetum coccineum]